MIVYYHGTTQPSLTSFQIGIPGVGESDQPVHGIWLSERIEGAQYHANLVKDKRETASAYIYEVTLMSCTNTSDATQSYLPDELFDNFRKTRNHFLRPFTSNKNWYFQYDKIVNSALRRKHEVPADYATNRIIALCHRTGIDAIYNPVVILHPNGRAIDINDPRYGKSLLLLNLNKVVSINLVKTI